MKNYILREQAEKILFIMNHFPSHDAFLLDIDASSGIGATITLSIDILHKDIPGKFVVQVAGPETW
jgi:hypothetical protein